MGEWFIAPLGSAGPWQLLGGDQDGVQADQDDTEPAPWPARLGHLSRPDIRYVCRRCGNPLVPCDTCGGPAICGDVYCGLCQPDG
jgi:hypothetical protein